MRPMQERVHERRGEQYFIIKSPPASGKSRALMFIALDKLHYQGLKKAIIVVPERSIGMPPGPRPSHHDVAARLLAFSTALGPDPLRRIRQRC
jgi:hypothetical protein